MRGRTAWPNPVGLGVLRLFARGGRVRVEMLEIPRRDTTLVDELVDITFLKADHTTELVRRYLTFVNKTIQGPRCDSQPSSGFCGSQPGDVFAFHTT